MSNENDAVADKKQKFPKAEPVLYDFHESSKTISEDLIPKHHPELASARILYMCRSKSVKHGNVPVPGTVKKAGPIEVELSRDRFDDEGGAHFVMMVALDVWNPMNPKQRIALIDHLLTRCVGIEDEKTGEIKFSVRQPQVQEFPEIAERHGRWNEGLVELGDCLDNKE